MSTESNVFEEAIAILEVDSESRGLLENVKRDKYFLAKLFRSVVRAKLEAESKLNNP